MKTAELKQKLHDYIDTAEEKKLKAIYTILESEIEDGNWWNDKDFVAELDRRAEECVNGTAKTYTLEESIEMARQAIKRPVVQSQS